MFYPKDVIVHMVNLSVPVPLCDIPERIHGASATFEVVYKDGSKRSYRGVIHSVNWLFDALVSRLNRDESIMYVGVSLLSGRFLCEITA